MLKNVLPHYLLIAIGHNIQWPCFLRVSARAKHCKLKLSKTGFTELVLPSNMRINKKEAQNHLNNMRPWLIQTLNKLFSDIEQKNMAQQFMEALEHDPKVNVKKLPQALSADILPKSVYFPILQRHWSINIEHVPNVNFLRMRQKLGDNVQDNQVQNGIVHIWGNTQNTALICKILQNWLKEEAKPILKLHLVRMAERMNLQINKVSVRMQRGRWGSCSSQKNVNLNARLILLPLPLVEHLFIHELCHLKYLNHSAEYHQYLEQFSPHWRKLEKELDKAWENIPKWTVACI